MLIGVSKSHILEPVLTTIYIKTNTEYYPKTNRVTFQNQTCTVGGTKQ